MLEDTVLRGAERGVGQALIVGCTTEHVGGSALRPVSRRGVDGRLDIATVEVDNLSWRTIVASIDYTKLAVEVRASIGDVVDVEARVNL